MKDIFDPTTIANLKSRIANIETSNRANWGKMNPGQMLRHCIENEKLMLREKAYKRLFIGRLFGKMALHTSIKDDAPMKKNNPTHPALRIKTSGNVAHDKAQWMTLLEKYPTMQPADYEGFVHPFFGSMNRAQVGRLAYKHIDHHLRQFGV